VAAKPPRLTNKHASLKPYHSQIIKWLSGMSQVPKDTGAWQKPIGCSFSPVCNFALDKPYPLRIR
jgi:hypothetical protein